MRNPSAVPAKRPRRPDGKANHMKMRSRLDRVAPMVRRMAMSRVLARASMMSDERMLNTAQG